jgi:tripartite-type tricarboxylate transporter receptor subunit TctC
MINRRRLVGLSAAALVAPALAGRPAQAQAWPNRFVRLIVPFRQGGPTDFVARLVAERLTRGLGVQVVIENRGGAGTNIGAELVARANPDGYTVLVGTGAPAINRNLYRTLAYDAATDLAPVTLMVILPFFMFVPNSSPARSVAEFVALAKATGARSNSARPAPAHHRISPASCSSNWPGSR